MKDNCLFIIDPHKDFMPGGALGIPGADKDMERLSEFILCNMNIISNITVSMDSHHSLHIAHPIWWIDAEGNHPDPFTQITKADVLSDNPKWRCTVPYFQDMTESYITQLEDVYKRTHTVWPPHCLIGSDGHAVEANLFAALLEWEKDNKVVEFVTKDSNLFTEHFGVFEASVPMDQFEETLFNYELFTAINKRAKIIIAGEASSHCVADTIRQMIAKMSPEEIIKLVYLSDACSPVPGCEELELAFIEEIRAKGVTITTTKDLIL